MDLENELVKATKKGLKVSFIIHDGVLYTEVTGRKPSDVLYTARKGSMPYLDCNLARDVKEMVYFWEVKEC